MNMRLPVVCPKSSIVLSKVMSMRISGLGGAVN